MLRSSFSRNWQWRTDYASRSLSTKAESERLRILFCGSDDFSIASLRALHEYSKSSESNILSIDVAAKKDKAAGRGLKVLRPPPIKEVAQELKLQLHQFNTFTGWAPPDFYPSNVPYINLVVAVSFGLLIPSRILRLAKYGGLNVHPSLLPELKGAAPLNWTIIKAHTHTGVSVQTLHPTKFDEGIVVSQTRKPGILVPEDVTTNQLRAELAPIGGSMLVDAIRQRLYLNPKPIRDQGMGTLAPKITGATKRLDWQNDDVQTIARKNRAIPKLWTEALQLYKKDLQWVRVLLGNDTRAEKEGDIPDSIREELLQRHGNEIEEGTPFAITDLGGEPSRSQSPIFLAIKNEFLIIPKILVAGNAENAATRAAAGAGLFKISFQIRQYSIHTFRAPLRNQS